MREIQTSRLINTACSLMLTFQAQTFIFASNISCQLHLGRSHFLSSPPSSNLVSSSSNPPHLFIYLISLRFPFLNSPPLFLLPSAFPPLYLSPFHLLVPAQRLARNAVRTQTHFLPLWSQNQPNQTPSNSSQLLVLLQDTDRSAVVCFPASVNYVTQLYHHRADAGKLN